jgi:formiminoglutamase
VSLFPTQAVHTIVPSLFCSKENSLGAIVLPVDAQKLTQSNARAALKNKVIIVGIPDDRGVKVNGGKPGAADGPNSFRKNFYALNNTKIKGSNGLFLGDEIVDAGDIVLEKTIEKTHENLARVVKFFLHHGVALVAVVGGGHDFSYGSYLGHASASGGTVPIVNFDAHFDLRPLSQTDTGSENINSGTPFFRIIENLPQHIASGKALLEIGIQRERNSEFLYNYAHQKGVSVVEFDAFNRQHKVWPLEMPVNILEHTKDFLDSCNGFGWHKVQNKIHCSIDLDVFAQSIAPGTSASTPFGFDLIDAGAVLSYFSENRLARVLDIAELCPPRDTLDTTARLAASLVYRFACNALEPC